MPTTLDAIFDGFLDGLLVGFTIYVAQLIWSIVSVLFVFGE